jgi:hypothetical protein
MKMRVQLVIEDRLRSEYLHRQRNDALSLPGSQSPPADFALLCNPRVGIAADDIDAVWDD